MAYVAEVSKDVADLVPGFLRRIRADLAGVERALGAADLAALRRYGERFSTLGLPYGFLEITQYGRKLLSACELGSVRGLERTTEEMRQYLDEVKIVVVRSPAR